MSANLLQGTLDLLILKALALSEMHGLWDLAPDRADHQWDVSGETGVAVSGAASDAEAGWLTSEWGDSENNRRAKYYSLTAKGRRQLETETKQWETISLAMASALQAR
jgi:DNA-binding PadR family transcriptional regulator